MKIKVYDTGSIFVDRYTVIFMNEKHENGDFNYLGMSEHPTHPQGVSMHGECKPGRHLGKKSVLINYLSTVNGLFCLNTSIIKTNIFFVLVVTT